MLDLPFYIPAVFILTTLLTLFFCYRLIVESSAHSKTLIIMSCLSLWLVLQGILAYIGVFRSDLDQMPPRLMLLGGIPGFFTMVVVLSTKWGQQFVDSLSLKNLICMSVVRIPVELCLYWLAMEKVVPEIMSFAGRNFDIVAGLTAPLVIYFGLQKNGIKPIILWLWNIGSLILLLNIIVYAILSAPFPLQQFGFDQPNIAILNFPFIWLATFVAPVVLFSHFILIRRLLKRVY